MKISKRILAGMGGLFLTALALQLLTPRAVHSTVAALVSVVGNVAVTNPVAAGGNPQALLTADTEQKAYNAFRVTTGYCPSGVIGECSDSFLNVTGTQVLVINDISAYCTATPSDLPSEMVVLLVNAETADFPVQYWIPPLFVNPGTTTNPGGGEGTGKNPSGSVLFGKQTYIVLDGIYNHLSPSITPTMQGNCSITYSGYYVHQ